MGEQKNENAQNSDTNSASSTKSARNTSYKVTSNTALLAKPHFSLLVTSYCHCVKKLITSTKLQKSWKQGHISAWKYIFMIFYSLKIWNVGKHMCRQNIKKKK